MRDYGFEGHLQYAIDVCMSSNQKLPERLQSRAKS